MWPMWVIFVLFGHMNKHSRPVQEINPACRAGDSWRVGRDLGELVISRDDQRLPDSHPRGAVPAPCKAINPVILRWFIIHQFLQVKDGVGDVPSIEHFLMRVTRHVDMVSHHQSDLLQGFLCKLASPFAGEATGGNAVHAGSMHTRTPNVQPMSSVERVSTSEDLVESPKIGLANL